MAFLQGHSLTLTNKMITLSYFFRGYHGNFNAEFGESPSAAIWMWRAKHGPVHS